jgi:hypothetical protein
MSPQLMVKKKMLVWVILPPNFDTLTKKYQLAPYYDFRGANSVLFFPLEFSINGCKWLYIVVAPNRRGMPGHG